MTSTDPAPRILFAGWHLLRVEVRFDCLGEMRLEYAATAAEARHFAAAMVQRGYHVVVDSKVRRGLRRLPCGRLWSAGDIRNGRLGGGIQQ